MIVKFGFWNIQTEPEVMFGKKFYTCIHKNNVRNVQLVFVKGDKLEGENKELVKFIEKEIHE